MKERPNGLSEAQAALNVLLICMIASSCTPESNEQVVLEPTQTKTFEVVPTETVIPPTPTVKVEEETQETGTVSVKSSQSEWLSALVANIELSEMEDIRVEYQREGKIYFDDLKDLAPDSLEDYLLAFREEDNDLYLLEHDEDGWFIDGNSYPINKGDEDVQDVFKWVEGRTGDLVIRNQEGDEVYKITGLTFYSRTPTPTPESSSSGNTTCTGWGCNNGGGTE